jgi:hypothetical protein
MLGIPWFSSSYGSDGSISQSRLKVWNSRILRFCKDSGIPFIDTYSLTQEYPFAYFNEATLKRHYNTNATRVIGRAIVDAINSLMSSIEPQGFSTDTFYDLSFLKSHTGVIRRLIYTLGGETFELLEVEAGGSLTITASGRGCFAFYPRADASVSFDNGLESGVVDITATIDAGYYYNVKRQALSFSSSIAGAGEEYDLVLTATTGNFYLRTLSFQGGVVIPSTHSTATFVSVSSDSVPARGITGRTYFLTDMGKPAWWNDDDFGYLGAEGRYVIGTTNQRDDVVVSGIGNGYRFYNTSLSLIQKWNGSAWV